MFSQLGRLQPVSLALNVIFIKQLHDVCYIRRDTIVSVLLTSMQVTTAQVIFLARTPAVPSKVMEKRQPRRTSTVEEV